MGAKVEAYALPPRVRQTLPWPRGAGAGETDAPGRGLPMTGYLCFQSDTGKNEKINPTLICVVGGQSQ